MGPHRSPAQADLVGRVRAVNERFLPLWAETRGIPLAKKRRRADVKKAGETTPHLPAVRIETDSCGETILPTLGWGKQSVWLAASGCQTPFCVQKLPPISHENERATEGTLKHPLSRLPACQFLICEYKERAFFRSAFSLAQFLPCLAVSGAVCRKQRRGGIRAPPEAIRLRIAAVR